MPPDLGSRIRAHLSAQTVAPIDGWLVTTQRGTAVRYDTWRGKVWSRIVETAEVGDLHSHDLRHTCATRLFVVDRWTPADVQAFLDHRDPRVTLAVYTHIEVSKLPTPSRLETNVDTLWTPGPIS